MSYQIVDIIAKLLRTRKVRQLYECSTQIHSCAQSALHMYWVIRAFKRRHVTHPPKKSQAWTYMYTQICTCESLPWHADLWNDCSPVHADAWKSSFHSTSSFNINNLELCGASNHTKGKCQSASCRHVWDHLAQMLLEGRLPCGMKMCWVWMDPPKGNETLLCAIRRDQCRFLKHVICWMYIVCTEDFLVWMEYTLRSWLRVVCRDIQGTKNHPSFLWGNQNLNLN